MIPSYWMLSSNDFRGQVVWAKAAWWWARRAFSRRPAWRRRFLWTPSACWTWSPSKTVRTTYPQQLLTLPRRSRHEEGSEHYARRRHNNGLEISKIRERGKGGRVRPDLISEIGEAFHDEPIRSNSCKYGGRLEEAQRFRIGHLDSVHPDRPRPLRHFRIQRVPAAFQIICTCVCLSFLQRMSLSAITETAKNRSLSRRSPKTWYQSTFHYMASCVDPVVIVGTCGKG